MENITVVKNLGLHLVIEYEIRTYRGKLIESGTRVIPNPYNRYDNAMSDWTVLEIEEWYIKYGKSWEDKGGQKLYVFWKGLYGPTLKKRKHHSD